MQEESFEQQEFQVAMDLEKNQMLVFYQIGIVTTTEWLGKCKESVWSCLAKINFLPLSFDILQGWSNIFVSSIHFAAEHEFNM